MMLKLLIICATISTIFAETKTKTPICKTSNLLVEAFSKFFKNFVNQSAVRRAAMKTTEYGHAFFVFFQNTILMQANLKLIETDACAKKSNINKEVFWKEYAEITKLLLTASYDTFMRFESIRTVVADLVYDIHYAVISNRHLLR